MQAGTPPSAPHSSTHERSDEERIITLDHRRPATVDAVLDAGQLRRFQELAARLPVPDSVVDLLNDLRALARRLANDTERNTTQRPL